LRDVNQKRIAQLTQKIFTLHRQFEISDLDDKILVIARTRKWLQLHSNVDVWFGSEEQEREPDIKIDGSFLARQYKFKNKSDEVIAEVSRKIFTKRNILTGNDTFHVYVAPTVDVAFILLLVVGLDEMFTDNKN